MGSSVSALNSTVPFSKDIVARGKFKRNHRKIPLNWQAVRWLKDLIDEHGKIRPSEVYRLAAGKSLTRYSVRWAKTYLGVISRPDRPRGPWYWQMPRDDNTVI
jgi:hypothetical protein